MQQHQEHDAQHRAAQRFQEAEARGAARYMAGSGILNLIVAVRSPKFEDRFRVTPQDKASAVKDAMVRSLVRHGFPNDIAAMVCTETSQDWMSHLDSTLQELGLHDAQRWHVLVTLRSDEKS